MPKESQADSRGARRACLRRDRLEKGSCSEHQINSACAGYSRMFINVSAISVFFLPQEQTLQTSTRGIHPSVSARLLPLLCLLFIHTDVQLTATKQANIFQRTPVQCAGRARRLFIRPRTARVREGSGPSVKVPQMRVFVLQVGFVGVNLTEVGAAAHSSRLINAAALFHLASVSDTYVHAAPITHSFMSPSPAVPCQSLAACCLLK